MTGSRPAADVSVGVTGGERPAQNATERTIRLVKAQGIRDGVMHLTKTLSSQEWTESVANACRQLTLYAAILEAPSD